MTHTVRLLERTEAAAGIWTYRLERPAGFRFRPGQWCFLNLPDLGIQDERGLRRHLSIASSPREEGLLFGTKDSESAFKRTLRAMPLGGELTLEEPRGALALPEDAGRPVALLAGGIGITPFRALIRHALDEGTGHRLTLFYSNRTPEESLFLEELQGWAAAADTFTLVATMTRMQLSARPWDGPTGRLDPELIRSRLPGWADAEYLLAGPPVMVDAMSSVLTELGIDPARVRPENFAGYGP